MAQPVRLVESGPAGGAILAARIAAENGEARALAFDMGGTTAKLTLIDDMAPQYARFFEVARAYRFLKGSGLPLRIPVIDMVEIGADTEFPGVHPQGRPATLSSAVETSIPAHMPILAAYAVLNDDLDLTEQQLFTCDPSACPPPTTICDPELFTVRQLLERMRDLQDYSSAQTLIEERYLAVNIDSFI